MVRRDVAVGKAAVLKLAQILVQRQSGMLTDEEAIIAPEAFEIWAAGMKYGKDQILQHDGSLYRVVQDIEKSLVSQPPSGEGLLSLYRPIEKDAAGTLEDPISYVYGMDCQAGLYYRYEGTVYLCKADMLPCVWPPDSGIWQWEVLAE